MATPEPSSDNRPPEPARGGNRGYGSYGAYGQGYGAYGQATGGYNAYGSRRLSSVGEQAAAGAGGGAS